MILNEFLQFKLGVSFEDKYNALAVEEILNNKEKYPLIAKRIIHEVEYAKSMKKTWNFESSSFDCDDDEFCADYKETMELYRAFVIAFSNDIKGKSVKVKYASYGLDYLRYPKTSCVLDPYFNYYGMNYILLTPKKTELVRKIYYPFCSEKEYLGIKSTEEYSRIFNTDNKETLKKVLEETIMVCEKGWVFDAKFKNETLAKYAINLENREIGYPCDSYEICIGKNLLRFFSTERGFDVLTSLRPLFLDCLDDEQRENKIVKNIKYVSF